MNMKEIADKLRSAGNIFINKEEMHDVINKMALAIYPCSKRNARGRTFKQVYTDCSRIVIEHALAEVLGGERNPLEWDYTVLESYLYDVRVGNILFEVKRHKIGTNWFSYPESGMKTFRKHANKIDYFVSAYMFTHKDTYEIRFALVANAKTFFNFFIPSKYPNQDSYYHHKNAKSVDQCIDIGLLPSTYTGK